MIKYHPKYSLNVESKTSNSVLVYKFSKFEIGERRVHYNYSPVNSEMLKK